MKNERDLERIRNTGLYSFLGKVADIFKKNPNFDIEESVIVAVARMNDYERSLLVEVARSHFLPSICHLHPKDIVNDEFFSDRTDGEPEGPIVEEKITIANLPVLFISENLGKSIRAHLRQLGWKELEEIELTRELNYDKRIRSNTPG